MSEREQHMDTDKRTGTSGQCGNTDEMRWDLGTLFLSLITHLTLPTICSV